MSPLKVGIFSPMFSEVNGTAKATRMLAFALAREGCEVHVYAPKADRFHPKMSNLVMHHIPSIMVNADPEVNMTLPFHRFFRPRHPDWNFLDVVHSISVETMGLLSMMVAKFNRAPKVVTHHSPFQFYVEEYLGKFAGKLIKQWVPYYERFIYGQFDLISTPTLSKKELLLKWGYRKKPILAISNGIEDKYFKKVDGNAVREKYKIGDRKLLVYASRMSPEKHIRHIVRVFPRILKRVPDAHLALVGTGPELEPAKKLVAELNLKDRVTITGFVPFNELLQWYNAADVTCIWSYVEAQGLVILEAMAQGTPTVGTNADGIKDTIIHGKTGFLADNLKDFVDKVVYLFENDDVREEFGKNARKYVEYHRIHNIARIWIQIYKKLIKLYPYQGNPDYNEKRKVLMRKIFKAFAERTPGVEWGSQPVENSPGREW